MSSEKRVDVVIVSYNSRDRLRFCVESLVGEPLIQVVVVDNASTDDSPSVVADLPVKLVRLDENVGFGGGCNAGWEASGAPYVLFLNPDAHLLSADVLSLADVAERWSAGAAAPRIVDQSGTLEWSLRRFPEVRSIYGQALFAHRLFPNATWADEVIRDAKRYDHEGICDWASGACLLVSREWLEGNGGFDASFFMYCEDIDLCRRIWSSGSIVVYTPAVICTHIGGASAPRWSMVRVLARSRIRYAEKHFGRGRAAAYRAGVTLSALTHVIGGRGVRGRLGHARALWAAMQPWRAT